MLYLEPGEQISAKSIALRFDPRAEIESGYLNGQLVFKVTVFGGFVGYIAPPSGGASVWGLNLCQGGLVVTGYYRRILRTIDGSGIVSEPEGISVQAMIEEDLVWDLEFFAPLEA